MSYFCLLINETTASLKHFRTDGKCKSPRLTSLFVIGKRIYADALAFSVSDFGLCVGARAPPCVCVFSSESFSKARPRYVLYECVRA